MVGQRIPGRVHVFIPKRLSMVLGRRFASSSSSLRWNTKNSLILLIFTISVAGLSYQTGEVHQKQMQAVGNLGYNKELLKPKHFKNSSELRSKSSLMGYKIPPYPLDDKGVQGLLEAGETVIKDGIPKHTSTVWSANVPQRMNGLTVK
jgi:hypothetical protein